MPDVQPPCLQKKKLWPLYVMNRRIELAAEGIALMIYGVMVMITSSKAMNGPSYAPNGYVVINKVWV